MGRLVWFGVTAMKGSTAAALLGGGLAGAGLLGYWLGGKRRR